MAKTQQKDNLFDNQVVDSFLKNNQVYTLEKRSDNLWVVRAATKTLLLTTYEEEARKKFELERPVKTEKGGENKMGEKTEGKAAAQAVVDKLKAEKAEAEEKTELARQEVKNQLAELQSNASLAAMYNDNATVGAENLAGNVPYLKVHAAGKSTSNFLANGKKPQDGFFFYKPTQEEFESITAHILYISNGFRAEGMNEKDGKKEMVFNQLMGGVFQHNGNYLPFIIFMTGSKLSRMWEFGKEASKYTKAKPVAIPMFALSVKLTTSEEKNNYGFSWVINFEIEKEENGFPIVVLDPGEFQFLKDSVDSIKEMIHSIINAKAKGEEDDQVVVPINAVNAVTANASEPMGVSEKDAAFNFMAPDEERF